MAKKNTSIEVQGTAVKIQTIGDQDYISLTDMVSGFEGKGALIENWIKNKDTILFLGIWERINNADFNSLEFEGIKNEAGRNSFYLSVKKWADATQAIGLVAKAGRYGGTYAHKDIAFEFGSWLSPEFKLYLIKEFQRLKDDENERLSLSWNLNRTLFKINYRIHTDAIKSELIPNEVSKAQAAATYASEADLLNVALFSCTAKEWRDANPELKGNIRDHAGIVQLLVLANIESMNAEFIHMQLEASERLLKLNAIAIRQMRSLASNAALATQLPNHEEGK